MERERLMVFRTTSEKRKQYKAYYPATSGNIRSYMLSSYYKAREQYVDNLTKRQQKAINLIRIMDEGDWVEGIGGKMGIIEDTTYILDC